MRLYILMTLLFIKLSVNGTIQPVLKEKVIIHTSVDTLMQGETLWFTGYLDSSLPLEQSDAVLYVDIVAVKSSAVIKRKVLFMKNGTANGDFYFGKDLPAGDYLLRGYTRWIAEYAPILAFEKVICLQVYQDDLTADSIIEKKTVFATPTSFKLDLYPEGRAWLANQQTRFAVKLQTPSGKSPIQSVTIFNKTGETIADFFTDSLGLGSFVLSSADEGNYAVLKQDAQQKKYLLPRFSDAGVAMKVIYDRDSLKIMVLQTGKDTLNKTPFLLVGKKYGEFFRRDGVSFGQKLTVIKIPNRFLPNGLLSFELYHGTKLVAERVVSTAVLNDDEISIKEKNKPDSALITIKYSPSTQLSLSATLRGVSSKIGYLSSELKNPSLLQQYAKVKHPDIDKLLLTLSAKDIKEVSLNKNFLMDYEPERGMRISGRVVDRKKALVGINVSLNLKSAKNSLLLTSQTDSLGQFLFDNLIFYGKSQLKLVAMNAAAQKVATILLDTTFTTLEIPVLPSDTLNKYSTVNLANRDSLRTETELKIKGNLLKEVVIKPDRLNFLLDGSFKALHKDQIFNLSEKDLEYRTLTGWMLNHIKGAVNPYGSNKSGEEGGIVFRGSDTTKVVGADNLYTTVTKGIYPQFVVNGREYFYDDKELAMAVHQQFSDLPLDKVKSIRVHRLTGYYTGIGVLVDKYIIYLTVDDTIAEKGVLTVKVNGFDESTPYVQDEVSQTEGGSSLVFWEPNIVTDQNGEVTIRFKNPQNIGKVTYQIEGKDVNGKFVSLRTTSVLKP